LAYTVYSPASVRLYRDIDLLVPPEHFVVAVNALQENGYQRASVELREGFDAQFAKAVPLADEQGRQVDIHRSLARGPFGIRIVPDDLFGVGTPFTIGGCQFLGLGPQERLLHACYHAALGDTPPQLVPLRDVAQLLLETPVDTARVLELARRWHGRAVLARAVTLAWNVLALQSTSPLVDLARSYVPTVFERLQLAAYRSPRRRALLLPSLSVAVVPGPRAKARYAAALLFPQDEFLRARGVGHTGWWTRRGVRHP
jgi:hypothetical protein